jgi:hypothetical protein
MPEQMQDNPIYKFMKANDLTKLDEKAFLDKYSAPEKAKEIHSFMVSNKLTDLDDAKFYDKYLKKKVGGEESSLTKSPSISQEYLKEGQELADKGFIKTEKLDPSQLVSQYKSPDISLTPKPKKNYYSDKLEKGLIFDKEGKLYEPSSEAFTKAITPAEQIDLKKPTQKDLVEKSREAAMVEEPEAPIEKQGWLLNMVSALDKGFAKNFISSPIKGLGTVLQGATKKVMGGTGEGFISNKLIQYGDYLNKAIDELTPQDEEFKNTLWDQAAQALGQVGSLVFTGGLAGAGKGATAALVSEVPKGAVATAAKALGSQLSSPTAVSAGLSMGQAEFDRAKEAGATDDQAFEAFYKNAATGSVLETIPVMQFFKRFNNTTGGSVTNYIKTKGVAGLTGGIEEMTTEIMQQIYSNKTAKDIYNINQDILDGVGSSGGIGFGVGFLLNAMGANAKILRKQGREQEAAVLENQVKQYEDNLEKPKVTSGNNVSAKDIVTQGVEIGTQKAVKNLDRDLANNVITPEQYQEGISFAEKASQVADKIPETVTGESRVKSIELLVERNDINQANQNLLQQKQTTDVAYHAGIDEEIKSNEERIKKIDSEVYNIAKKPSKEFGTKTYVVDGEEVSKEAFEALQGKPLGTKTVIKAEVKPIIEEPNQEQIQDDIKNNRLATFTYKSEQEIPEVFKDRISSTGENTLPDGTVEKFVRVTVPQSIADYELGKTEPTEVKVAEEVKPTEVVEPIRQLGTGANVYFENNKYRVNDNSKGKVLLNIEGKEEGGMAIANIEFDSPKEAVEVAKELAKIYPSGVPDAVLINKVVDDIRNKIKVKPTEVKEEVKIKNITPENIEDKLKYIEFEVTDNDNAGVKDIHHGSDVYKTGSTIVRNDIKYPTYVIIGRNESNYFEFIINDKGEVEPLNKDVVKVNQLSKNEIDVKDTAKKLQDIADSRQLKGKIDEKTYQLYNDVEKIVGRFDYTKNKWEDVAKFYHKALKDGSNPELVKIVGDYLEGSYTPKEPKVYNAKDLKKNPEILKEDEDANTITYPRSFVRLSTNMLALKSAGHENAKIGDVINIFKKDYVIKWFLENKKNPNETKIGLIRVDKDGNILRERDLSKKEQKEGKAKEFEEEEEIEVEPEQITKDDVKKAEAKFAAAEDRFKKARNKIEATQVKQAGMFGGEQKGMFAMGGTEAKSTLDPLRKATKEAKAELDDIRNRIKVQEVAQPELAPVESKSDEDFVDNKIKLVKEQGSPLSEFKKGDKVSWASDFNDRWKQYSEGVIVKTGTEYEIERFSNNPMFKRFKTFRLNSGDRVIMKPSKEANYTGEENIEKKYKDVLKAKQEADKKQNRQIGAEKATVTKEIYRRVNEMDAPADAEQVALRYLADGGTVSKEAVDEAYGSVKRAELNVKRRVSLSEEVKSKDFVQGNETLDDLAHRLWEVNNQKIPEDKIKDKLMAEIGNNNSRLEAAEAYLDKYNAEYKQEKEEIRLSEQYKEQYLEEQAEIEKELRKPLDEQIEGEASEEHINNLINQYEAEIKGEDQQLRPESEGDVSKETGKRKVAEKTSETELAKEYKEVVGKASKKAKENAKKEFVDRNFDNIVKKLKIQIKCPT